MTLPKKYGGLAVPDLYKYYQATLLGHLIDWCRHGVFKICPILEQAQSRVFLQKAPWCFSYLPTSIKAHPLVGPNLRLYYGLFSKGKLSTFESLLFSILGNPQFAPGLRQGAFNTLLDQSLYQVFHFVSSRSWPTF